MLSVAQRIGCFIKKEIFKNGIGIIESKVYKKVEVIYVIKKKSKSQIGRNDSQYV